MPEYAKSKLYQIKNTIDNDTYVGSTTEPLDIRMSKHRHEVTRGSAQPIHAKMSELGTKCFYIELIEEYPCASKQELAAREGHYIRERGTLNKVIAGRSNQQWKQEHKEQIADINKQYYSKHREDNLQYKREKVTCECGRIIRRSGMSEHRKSKLHVCVMHDLLLVPGVEGKDTDS